MASNFQVSPSDRTVQTYEQLKEPVVNWARMNGLAQKNIRVDYHGTTLISLILPPIDKHGRSLSEDGLDRHIEIYVDQEKGTVSAIANVDKCNYHADGIHATLTAELFTIVIMVTPQNVEQVLTELKHWAEHTNEGMLKSVIPLRN